MSSSHKNTILTSDSQYLSHVDPATRKSFQVGDRIIICSQTSEALLASSLSASENRCPFCKELLSSEKLPPVSSPSPSAQKKPASQPTYEQPSRPNLGRLATISAGGIFFIVLFCVVGALIFFLINSGTTTGAPDPSPISYSTQEPTSMPVRVFTPTPRPTQKPTQKPTQDSSSNNQSSGQSYATISCAQIFVINLRRTPGYIGKDDKADSLYEVPCGEIVELLGPTKKVDGLTWWNVSWNGYNGWVADHTGSGKIILDFNP